VRPRDGEAHRVDVVYAVGVVRDEMQLVDPKVKAVVRSQPRRAKVGAGAVEGSGHGAAVQPGAKRAVGTTHVHRCNPGAETRVAGRQERFGGAPGDQADGVEVLEAVRVGGLHVEVMNAGRERRA